MPEKRQLLILGVHSKSEGYPNTLYRIQFLQQQESFEVSEINRPLASPALVAKNKGAMALCKTAFNAGTAHLAILLRYLARAWKHKPPQVAYLPYPAILTAACLSLLPARLRPSCIILDAFISLYDTVVVDRKLLGPHAWLARLLYRIEHRAFRIADRVVVDTAENARYLSQLFKLPTSKFKAIPLSTDERNFSPSPYAADNHRPCKVLFIGTMIPLHGIRVIAETIQQIGQRDDLHILLIGDGQDAGLIEQCRPLPANVTWQREWQDSMALAEAIRSADICLGIFDDGDKAQRVCPYKLYAYASIGRAIVTGRTSWSSSAACEFGGDAFALISPDDSQALARKIIELAENPEERIRLADASRAYYMKYLGNHIAHQKLMQLLDSSGAPQQDQKPQA